MMQARTHTLHAERGHGYPKILVTALLALSLGAGARATDLRLVILDRASLPQDALSTARDEAARIFDQLGAQVSWLDEPEVQPYSPSPGEVHIVISPGKAERWRMKPHTLGAAILTATPNSGGVIVVLAASISKTVAKQRRSAVDPYDPSGSLFARGLGRVIAHEVIHTVTPEHPHSHQGVMNDRQDRISLIRPNLAVDPVCAQAFQTGLSRLAQQWASTDSASIPAAANR